MITSNSKADSIRNEIENLRKKIKLSESKEEIMGFTDEINSLTNQLKMVNRKSPNVVAVKDAKTVGDKIEAKLASRASGGKMRNRSVMI